MNYLSEIRNPTRLSVKQLRRQRRLRRERLAKMQARQRADKEKETKNGLELGNNTQRTAIMRNKRSLPLKEIGAMKELQIEDLRQFSEDNGDAIQDEAEDYNDDVEKEGEKEEIKKISVKSEAKIDSKEDIKIQNDEETTTKSKSQQNNKSYTSKNSKGYRKFAFDTANLENFNDYDDLLNKFYTRQPRRATYDHLGTFSDVMQMSASEAKLDDQDELMKRLHYANKHFLNDDVEVESNVNNSVNNNVFDEYENDDDDY